jgi:hypothetical protein
MSNINKLFVILVTVLFFTFRSEAAPSGLQYAVTWPNGYAYFFDGAGYVKYDMNPTHEGVVAGYPKPIQGNWPRLFEASPIYNTAVTWDNGFAYFFMGKNYVKYDINPGTEGVVAGPLPIKGNWPGLAERFPNGVDAAIVWPNGFAYFFKGNQYVKYDMNPLTEGVVAGPLPIKGNWPGLAEKFPNGIDTVVTWNNGFAYFFKGNQYVKYDMNPATEGVVAGPSPIKGNWPRLAEAFRLP